LHRGLERLASEHQSHPAGALVDDGRPDGSLRSLSPDAGPPVLMAKRGDRRALAQARAANYLAGDEIARFLTRVNPSHWPPRVIKQTIATIVELTLTEALARVHGDYFVDIVAYEQLHQEMLAVADLLVDGIVNQFPEMFGTSSLA